MTDATSSAKNSYSSYLARVNLVKLAYEAKKEALKQKADSSSVETDPYNKDPPAKNRIAVYSQETDDVYGDNRQNARAVGDLTRGKTRLNVISALTKNDKVDWYSFNVTQKDPTVGLSYTQDSESKGGLRVQIIGKSGRVIADSEAASGDTKENYDNLSKGALSLAKGTYYLKVTRATGDLGSTTPSYAIQLTASKYYRQDYDTTEYAVSQIDTLYTSVNTQSTASVSAVLNALAGGDLFDMLL